MRLQSADAKEIFAKETKVWRIDQSYQWAGTRSCAAVATLLVSLVTVTNRLYQIVNLCSTHFIAYRLQNTNTHTQNMTRTRKGTSVCCIRKHISKSVGWKSREWPNRRWIQQATSVGVQIPSVCRTGGGGPVCGIVQHVQESTLHRRLQCLRNSAPYIASRLTMKY